MAATALNAKSLVPHITASDLERSIRFYTEGLGFEIAHKHETDGHLQYVTLKAGDAQLGIGRDDFAKGRDRVKGTGLRLWISTKQDITAQAERAKTAGIKLDEGPQALPWGPMAFAVTDPDGFKVTIAHDE
jgi:catechol 2,3-dioxygenase-like lactoylglutathione lyase family enzyme